MAFLGKHVYFALCLVFSRAHASFREVAEFDLSSITHFFFAPHSPPPPLQWTATKDDSHQPPRPQNYKPRVPNPPSLQLGGERDPLEATQSAAVTRPSSPPSSSSSFSNLTSNSSIILRVTSRLEVGGVFLLQRQVSNLSGQKGPGDWKRTERRTGTPHHPRARSPTSHCPGKEPTWWSGHNTHRPEPRQRTTPLTCEDSEGGSRSVMRIAAS